MHKKFNKLLIFNTNIKKNLYKKLKKCYTIGSNECKFIMLVRRKQHRSLVD